MPDTDVYYYTDKLKDRLADDRKVIDISLEFANFKENAARVKFLEKLLGEYDLLGTDGIFRVSKSNSIAEQCRMNGNKVYSQSKFLKALEFYNQCLCFVEPRNENEGLAYANRSAVYMELKLFQLCLDNIAAARKANYPAENLWKLDKREQSCLEMINNGVRETSNEPIGKEFLKLTHQPNSKIPFIVDCLKLESSDNFGRFITTTKDLVPGDVIAVEEPFSTFLLPAQGYKACANCLNDNFLNLKSCKNCTAAMFCSDECEKIGNAKFHRFECPIVDKMDVLGTKILRISIRTFFEALDICNGNIQKLKAVINENSPDITVFDFEHPSSKVNLLKAIDALASNENQRKQSDLFQRAGIVGVFCNLLINHTELGGILLNDEDRDFFRSFIFKQTQIAACNYHGLFNGAIEKREVELNVQHGSGSFPFCSLINHSCAPNVVRLSSGGSNYVVVNRLIPEGEQIFDNYGFHHCLEPKRYRQAGLASQYMFQCECEGCSFDYPLFGSLRCYDRFMVDSIQNDVAELSNLDADYAKKKISEFCKYLLENADSYPCYELSTIQECLLRCFTIFAFSEFKLKLCAK